jgi:hypothetical protein
VLWIRIGSGRIRIILPDPDQDKQFIPENFIMLLQSGKAVLKEFHRTLWHPQYRLKWFSVTLVGESMLQ